MRSSSGVQWGRLRRARDVGAARVEFAVIVAIFATWVIVSIAMFQQGVRDVYAAASGEGTVTGPPTPGTAPPPAESDLPTAPTSSAPTTSAPAEPTPTTAKPTSAEPPARAPTTAAPRAPVPTTYVPSPPESPTVPASPRRDGPATSAPPPAIVPVPVPVPVPPAAAPTSNPTTPAPPPPTPATTSPNPPTPALTTSAPPTPPVAGPTLALVASVAKKGTLASNLLTGLNPAATLAAIAITSGGGDLVWTTMQGDYVFSAPNGRSTTDIRFTYVQNGFQVTDNTLTISTG